MKAIYPITPVPKPRMTQQDKWKKRDCVLKYWAFKDEVRYRGVQLPEQPFVHFVLPMPNSWSRNKKILYIGRAHQQKPDVDNLLKALLDALYKNDAHVWDIRMKKTWGREGMIIIEDML